MPRRMLWLVQLTTAIVLTTTVAPGDAIDCFLCSYSPPRGNFSRNDSCTKENFVEDETEIRTCELGCEAVTIYDINGELESFHRNCATKSTIITNSCETYKTIALTREVCSCNWNYCNSASKSVQIPARSLAVVASVMTVSWLIPKELLRI